MRIENATTYDTRVLRTLVCRAHADLRRYEGKLETWRGLRVHVRYRRGSRMASGGYATYSGYWILLALAREHVTTRTVAWIAYHELLHSYGYAHRQYHDATTEQVDRMIVGLPELVPVRAPTPKPPVDVRAWRYARVLAREKAWTRRLKRAETALRALRRQRRYYERAAASVAPPPTA